MIQNIENIHILAFTHHQMTVSDIGLLHIDETDRKKRLTEFKSEMQLDELMFLSTCNRVEFILCSEQHIDNDFIHRFLNRLYPETQFSKTLLNGVQLFSGKEAVDHILSVASSVDSMVVGEREIITQVRKAYEESVSYGISGDFLRILIRQTIETAKKVYTETNIAKKPVSVVSLAYHTLRHENVSLDARILIVGAGVTNTNMSRFLKKHGFTNFHVFNRTLSKAQSLANDLNGVAHSLNDLTSFNKGFDILITCTGSEEHIISPEIYTQLLQGETNRKIVIDIAIPQDLSPAIKENHNVHHISVEALQKISNENLKERSKELTKVHDIIRESSLEFNFKHTERCIEVAMQEVPLKVKALKNKAVNEVFANEISCLDESSKEVLDKIISYMEKNYIKEPMLLAKEIILNQAK